jgi:hypothetical protein
VEVRVGPDRREIEVLRNHDDGGYPLDTMLHMPLPLLGATTTFMRGLGETTVEDAKTSSGITMDISPGSRPTGSNNTGSFNLLGNTRNLKPFHGQGEWSRDIHDSSRASIPSLKTLLTRK